jgi:ferredoxin
MWPLTAPADRAFTPVNPRPFVSHARKRCEVTTVRITIDPVACDAYGYCAELLPEAIVLDEWGYPMVDGQPVPESLVEAARRAARDCPRRAITLTERKNAH